MGISPRTTGQHGFPGRIDAGIGFAIFGGSSAGLGVGAGFQEEIFQLLYFGLAFLGLVFERFEFRRVLEFLLGRVSSCMSGQ